MSTTSKTDSATHDLFRVLTDALPHPILITNEKAEIAYVNTAWEKLFGFKLNDVKGLNPRKLQSGLTPRDVYKRMWAALNTGKSFHTDEIIDTKKDGSVLNLLAVMLPIQSEGGRLFVQILTDITEQKQADKARQGFLDASHWSITPPLVKLHFLQDIVEKSSDKKVRAHLTDLKAVEDELLRLDRLTKKLVSDFL
jgi:PAS domain S-box-containing protein